jgi:hypothetical protein
VAEQPQPEGAFLDSLEMDHLHFLSVNQLRQLVLQSGLQPPAKSAHLKRPYVAALQEGKRRRAAVHLTTPTEETAPQADGAVASDGLFFVDKRGRSGGAPSPLPEMKEVSVTPEAEVASVAVCDFACTGKQVPACCSCAECGIAFCASCRELHAKVPALGGHEVKDLGDRTPAAAGPTHQYTWKHMRNPLPPQTQRQCHSWRNILLFQFPVKAR